MPQIAEPITSLEQELELRIEWLENGLKEIANGRDDMNPVYLKQQAQAILDGEPTTADKYNDVISQYEDHEIQSDIKKVQSKIKETTTADEHHIDLNDKTREENINKKEVIKKFDNLMKDVGKYISLIGYRGERDL